jgi:hypothetical protein
MYKVSITVKAHLLSFILPNIDLVSRCGAQLQTVPDSSVAIVNCEQL